MNLAELKDILQRCGVVGAGGAGFPAYAKLSNKADTIILNCAECEPLLYLHRSLLREKCIEILKAFSLLGDVTGAKCIIGIKKAYTETLKAIYNVIDNFSNVSVKELDEVYPMGDEVVLIYEVTGKVVPAGDLPISVGVTVFNVETVYNIYGAVFENKNVTHKFVTVGGEIANPQTVYAPIGMTFKEIIDYCGGAKINSYCILRGGVMMGALCDSSEVVTKTTNALLLFPPEHIAVKNKQRNTSTEVRRAAASCCQCKMCTDLCPRHLLGHPIDPAEFMRDASQKNSKNIRSALGALYCSSCGLCETFACMQGLSPRALLENMKAQLKANGVVPEKIVTEARAVREYRKVPLPRLAARMNLLPYEHESAIGFTPLSTKSLRIKLSQHIGAPSVGLVKEGDRVVMGQEIGHFAKGLSVSVASPIDGTVKLVGKEIIIDASV